MLTLDLGNSSLKLACFEKGKLVNFFKTTSLLEIEKRVGDLPFIYCSVRKEDSSFLDQGYNVFEYFFGPNHSQFPINYAKTIGTDRLVAAYHAAHLKPETPVCVIDMGSFTTVDFAHSVHGFTGGFILPGRALLHESYKKGAQLREYTLEDEEYPPKSLPQCSVTALSGGLSLSLLAPIEKILKTYGAKEIFLTGGAAKGFVDTMKTKICRNANIHFDPYLIHHSLYSLSKKVME